MPYPSIYQTRSQRFDRVAARLGCAAVALTALCVPALVHAQSVALRGEYASVRSDYFGPLVGASVVGVLPFGNSGASLQIGAGRLAGSSTPTARACGGFLLRGQFSCEPERLEVNAKATEILAGLRLRIGPQWRGALHVGGNLGFSKLSSRGVGVASRASYDQRETMLRSDAFLEAELVPWPRHGVGIVAGYSFGAYSPTNNEVVLDGFTPLNESTRVWRSWLGVSWSRAGRAEPR